MYAHLLRDNASEQARPPQVCENGTHVATSPPLPPDVIVVSRQYMEQLQRHVNLGYGRFPNRHIRQSILILQHIMGGAETTP